MGGVIAVVVVCTVLGLVWACINVKLVRGIDVRNGLSSKDSDSLSAGDIS